MSITKHYSSYFNLVGETLFHKSWGKGIVEAFDNSKLIVCFENTEYGKKVATFQFPDAFSNGFLTTNNIDFKHQIDQLIEATKCVICGRCDVKTEIIDNIRICPKCKTEKTQTCYLCKKIYNKSLGFTMFSHDHYYRETHSICPDCANKKTFICQECTHRLHNKYKSPYLYKNHVLCIDCFENVAKACHFCNHVFSIDDAYTLYDNEDNSVDVCNQCVPKHTFKCSCCGDITLNELKVTSKFIADDENICPNCVNTCAVCNEKIKLSSSFSSFDKHYCKECWSKYMKKCSICGDEFVSEASSFCPECEKSKEYIKRLQTMDFCSVPYKKLSYYSLEYINRCDLFTNLFINCTDHPAYQNKKTEIDPCNFIVLDIFGKKVVITYLNKNIYGDNRFSLNLTMTQFRSRKGKSEVYKTLNAWLPTSENILTTAVGSMHILNYPILLRVQTEFDKIYGKEWNGPDDYIEIGNYGDTTDFYMIGVIS